MGDLKASTPQLSCCVHACVQNCVNGFYPVGPMWGRVATVAAADQAPAAWLVGSRALHARATERPTGTGFTRGRGRSLTPDETPSRIVADVSRHPRRYFRAVWLIIRRWATALSLWHGGGGVFTGQEECRGVHLCWEAEQGQGRTGPGGKTEKPGEPPGPPGSLGHLWGPFGSGPVGTSLGPYFFPPRHVLMSSSSTLSRKPSVYKCPFLTAYKEVFSK